MKWTSEQEQAIMEKGSNILVAAAAGSGKTAVLVERIINKIIKDHIDIDKILVVTFTNAAASEMRERILDAIYKKLDKEPNNEELQRQIFLLNKSSICTIHSFCLDVIHNNFFELDIPSNFRIADTTEIELLKQEVLEDLFEEKYNNNDSDFLKLIETYTSYSGDEPLKESCLEIYEYIQSSPFPNDWLEEKVEMFAKKENDDFAKSTWGKILINKFAKQIENEIIMLENVRMKLQRESNLDKFIKVIRKDIDMLEEIRIATKKSWNDAYNVAMKLEFDKWPVDRKIVSDTKEQAKKIRDIMKKNIKKIIDEMFSYNSEEAYESIYEMYEILKIMKNLIIDFKNKFSKSKKERNIIDFNDIEHMALEILVKKDGKQIIPTEVCKKYQEKFEEIAIDEYQDSNLVQEYILNSISRNNNIFMVGDVKQSIYRFRQARPELFLEKYNKYKQKNEKEESENLKIKLFKNFRSRKTILDITNLIFENIMSKEFGDIDYNEQEYLNYGANYAEGKEEPKTQIYMLDMQDGDELEEESEDKFIEKEEIEAKFVAKKIREIVDSKELVWDKKQNKYREVMYKDIVVLLRSTSVLAPIYEKEIMSLNIPVFSDTSSQYLDSIEISTIMSLLKIIDNPMQDIPLVTVLRSPIFNFSDNELVEIRLCDKKSQFYVALRKSLVQVNDRLKSKIEDFLNKIEEFKQYEKEKPLNEFIWKIYIETGYYDYVTLMQNGKQRRENLKLLFEKAKQYEKASFKGLFHFINFIERMKLGSQDMGAAKIIGENEDVVRIMSIHKSKGLEFPIVFLSSTGKKFNLRDLNGKILLHQDLGIGPEYINYERKISYSTMAKEAIKLISKRESLSEEMRVLYVALTRAKEKLIITGISNNAKKDIERKKELLNIYGNEIQISLLEDCKNYLDWIMYVQLKENPVELIDFYIQNVSDIDIEEKEEENQDKLKEIEYRMNGKWSKEIAEKLEWKYTRKGLTNIPTKMSVTQIKRINERKEEKEKIDTVPNFMKEEIEITSARKGTLMHLCIQKMDENKEYSITDIKEFIRDLEERYIITKKEAMSIPIKKLYEYTKTKLWKELKEAKQIKKEEPFYIEIPANEIMETEDNEKILVQGIIDLYYINKNDELILVDYKTDYVKSKEELVNKYRTQINLYAKALEKALGKKIAKKEIFSIYLEEEIEIEQIGKT